MAESQSSESQTSEITEEDLMKMEEQCRPDNTKKSTEYGIKRFKDWLNKRNIDCNFHVITADDLNGILRQFYGEFKTKRSGYLASPSTLTCVRAAIQRYLNSAPYSRPFNLVKDREFIPANNIFKAKCKIFFKTSMKKPQHKPVIGDGDMSKLGDYFKGYKDNPQILIESVWFYLCYYFGRRSREGWAKMTKGTFSFAKDSEGHDYIYMPKTECTKNYQGGNRQVDIDYSDQHMYGPGVEIFRYYLSKLNMNNDRLFQHPKKAYLLDGEWYENKPMGKNTLSSLMKTISKKAGLSREYTGHSVRASTITKLHQGGKKSCIILKDMKIICLFSSLEIFKVIRYDAFEN